MILLGIPRYRLPLEVIAREVGLIAELGVEFRFNTPFGREVTFDQLRRDGVDAVFLAVGAHSHLRLNIPGEAEFPQVMEAIGLLRRVALGEPVEVGRRVVVIGGGNVAIDAARTCLRLGCREVVIAYRRTMAEMPADHEEIEQALEEGVRIEFLTIPVAIDGSGGTLQGLRCLKAKLVQKEGSTRLFPVPIDGSEFLMPADTVIAAIGQQVERSPLATLPGLKWTRWGTIEVDPVTMETAVPGVFAAGDAVSGPATVVQAIGGGKRAAAAIDRFLSGCAQPRTAPAPSRHAIRPPSRVTAARKQEDQRPKLPTLDPHLRTGSFDAVELAFPRSRRPARGRPLPALRHLPALRGLRRDLPLPPGGVGADPRLRGRAGRRHGFPGDGRALHRLRGVRGQLRQLRHAHRGPRGAADPLAVRDRAEPARPGLLRALRRNHGPGAVPGLRPAAHRRGPAGRGRRAALRRLRPGPGGRTHRPAPGGLKEGKFGSGFRFDGCEDDPRQRRRSGVAFYNRAVR